MWDSISWSQKNKIKKWLKFHFGGLKFNDLFIYSLFKKYFIPDNNYVFKLFS